ncbi:hypothetical protein FHS31_002903 [Sphingomonas vulcanisoli]|uniref:DUF4863 family protein n=1 Tax=Sphingomonas vulcanisoli TaxID=1658060 RepID=A0ABX0TUR4_9SPHN|nr:DUF4863 family protein [Sphingomonas vulcanisoli]NIJ09271.1 hypothetical protein [Sphingomonas vulcanisoli]
MAEVPSRFVDLIATITGKIDGQPVEPALTATLNAEFPADGPVFTELEALCHQGTHDGWLCAREHGGIKFGRPVKPAPETHGFSVDVVEMTDIEGPHHAHPNGEIDMVMPIDADAAFDGTPRGWKVYGPGSAHHPTVRGGKALILYLLPQGAIEFTRA